MMDRRTVFAGLVLAGPDWAHRALAQALPTPVRLGYLWIGEPGSEGAALRGLLAGLKEVGLVEGQNLVLEKRYGRGQPALLGPMAQELVDLRPAVIVVAGTVASKAVLTVTRTVPIVATSADPVGAGLAASLARPGGNLTGMAVMASDMIAGKWLELLLDMQPALKRVAIVLNPESAVNPVLLANIRAVAAVLRVEIVLAPLGRGGDVAASFALARSNNCDGVVVGDDALLLSQHEAIVAAATTAKLPAIYGHRQYVEAGGLMSYSSNIEETWRRAGGYIDRILKGARPGDLPIQQPTKIELIINLKTAKALGLTVPPSILLRTDEVIE